MKTQFLNFGGGLIAGVLLVTLFSASTMTEESEASALRSTEEPPTFHNVPLKEFFQNAINYRDQHARLVTKRNHPKVEASRMFIYSVPVLEDFFKVIKGYAETAELDERKVAIRFYYAVYPKNQMVRGRNYGHLHTLYMVPNYWSDSSETFIDIDIQSLALEVEKTGGYTKPKEQVITSFSLENRHRLQPEANALMLDATTAPDLPGIVINQGQLCPPACPNNSLIRYMDGL